MVPALRVLILVLCVAAFAVPVFGQQIDNWPAPPLWSPPTRSASADSGRGLSAEGIAAIALTYSPFPFIALAPCRIVDTRGNGAPIQGGIFPGGSDVRNSAVAGICGIP